MVGGNAERFRTVLTQQFEMAKKAGLPFIELTASELHRVCGGYPGRHHQAKNCCRVMESEKRSDDEIIFAPLSIEGASLNIRCKLPRSS